MAKVDVKTWLSNLPVIERDPFKYAPNEPIYAVHVAMVYMDYRTYKKRDPQVGFVFGLDKDGGTLYISRYAIEESEGFRACNSHEIYLDTQFISEVDVLKELKS
jgi:hypothetical protein